MIRRRPPKRPRSGYNFFQLSFIAEGSKTRHTQHAAKEISKSWRKMTAEEKRPFMDMANYDLQRYTREIDQFEEAIAHRPQQFLGKIPPRSTISDHKQISMQVRQSADLEAEIHTPGVPPVRLSVFPQNFHVPRASSSMQNVPQESPIAVQPHHQAQNYPNPPGIKDSRQMHHPLPENEGDDSPPSTAKRRPRLCSHHSSSQMHRSPSHQPHPDQPQSQSRLSVRSQTRMRQCHEGCEQSNFLRDTNAEQLTRMLQMGMLPTPKSEGAQRAIQSEVDTGKVKHAEKRLEEDVLLPLYLRSAKHVLSAAMSKRLSKLEELEATPERRDLGEMERLVREINLCREQLTREDPDSFEAVLLSIRGSRKISSANIPSIFVSFTSFSLCPVEELVGSIFEVELSWKRAGIRCTTRALIAMGSSSRAELVLGTLRPMSAALGSKVSIRFVRFIRTRKPFADTYVSTKNQIMLDLWSMGLQLADKKAPGKEMNVESNPVAKDPERNATPKLLPGAQGVLSGDSAQSSTLPPLPPELLDMLKEGSSSAAEKQLDTSKLKISAEKDDKLQQTKTNAETAASLTRHGEPAGKKRKRNENIPKTKESEIEGCQPPQKTAFDLMLEEDGGSSNALGNLLTADEKQNALKNSGNCANCQEPLDQSASVCYDDFTKDMVYCSERCRTENEQRILDEFVATSLL